MKVDFCILKLYFCNLKVLFFGTFGISSRFLYFKGFCTSEVYFSTLKVYSCTLKV